MQRVPGRTRDHHARQADALVIDQVQPRGALATPEEFWIGPGSDAPDGHDEADAVHAADQPASQGLRKGDAGLGLHQRSVRSGKGLRSQVGLVDVADAPPGQGLHVRVDDCRVLEVEGLHRERGGDGDVQVLEPGLPARYRGERLEERRLPAHDLEHHLADVDVRDHRLHAGPQVGQARRIGDRIDLGGVQPAVGIDDHLGVGFQAPSEVPQYLVEVPGVLSEQLVGVLG